MARGTWGGAGDPHVAKITVRLLIESDPIQFGFHLRDVAVQDNTEQEIADEVRLRIEAPVRNLILPVDTFEGVSARFLGGDTGAEAAGAPTAGTNDFAVATRVPQFMACHVSLKSEIRKRYGRGGFYLPVRSETFLDSNNLNATYTGLVGTLITAMTDHFTGNPATHDLLLVNAHAAKEQSPSHPALPASWYDVTSLKVDTEATFLRSRKR